MPRCERASDSFERGISLFRGDQSTDELFIVGSIGGLKGKSVSQSAGLPVVDESLSEHNGIGQEAGDLNGVCEVEEFLCGRVVEAPGALQSGGYGSVVDCRGGGIELALRNHDLVLAEKLPKERGATWRMGTIV